MEPPPPEDNKYLQNGNVAKQVVEKPNVDNNYNSMKDYTPEKLQNGQSLPRKSPEVNRNVDTKMEIEKTREETPKKVDPQNNVNKTPTIDRRMSKTSDTDSCRIDKRRQSLKSDQHESEESVCHRRVSVPSSRTTPKKKSECGTHVVAKSELWDTGSQHRCSKSHQKASRVSISQDEGKHIIFKLLL